MIAWLLHAAITGEKKHRVYSRIPPGGEYIPVTATDGVKSGYMNVETLASDDLVSSPTWLCRPRSRNVWPWSVTVYKD